MTIKLNNQVLISKHNNRPFGVDLVWDNHQTRPSALTVFLHGYKGFKNWGAFDIMAEKFADAGLPFLKFNFSHNGTSISNPGEFVDLDAFGKNNISIELDDIESVFEAVESDCFQGLKPHILPECYNLIGFSRGGANAIINASKNRRCTKLVTWNAVADFTRKWNDSDFMLNWKTESVRFEKNTRTGQLMPLYYSFVEDYYNNEAQYTVIEAARKVTQPWLLVHATDDEAVPLTDALRLKEVNDLITLIKVGETGHTFGVKHPHFGNEISAPFREVIEQTILFLSK